MAQALADYQGSECPQHVISKPLRKEMRRRGQQLRLTAEFGRPYRCIVDSFKSYQLDDWLHFLETFSLYGVQGDMLDNVMQDMWDKMRYSSYNLSSWHVKAAAASDQIP